MTDPLDQKSLDQGWSLIRFDDSIRSPLPIATLDNDAVALYFLAYPYTNPDDPRFDTPLFEVGLLLFKDGSPYIPEEDLDRGASNNSYSAYFGPELEPFIVHWEDSDHTVDNPLGDSIASWENKRALSDDESKAIVDLVSASTNAVSSEIS